MADQDFNIKVVTTADTSGLRETSAALDDVSSKARLGIGPDTATLAARQASLRGALTPVPDELSGAADSAEKLASEMDKTGTAALFAGINIGRARQEATFLARELATGVPTTRTLSSLLGALGPGIAIAAGAGFALNRALVANAERQLKINQELDVQLTKVTELAQKWSEIGKGVTGPEDMLRLTSAIIPTLDQASSKFREFQNQGVSAWKEFIDIFTAGIPGAGKIFEQSFQAGANVLAENTQRLREAGIAAAKLGEETETAFDAKKAEPFAQAISELNADIADHTAKQKSFGVQNIEDYTREGNLIRQKKAQLQEILNLQKQGQQAQDQAVSKADPQVQAILRNEQAAAAAKAAGNERDAELFQRSADQYKASATPQQLEDLQRIHDLQDKLKPFEPLPGRKAGPGESQDLVNQMERQRIAAEKQNQLLDAAQEKSDPELKATNEELKKQGLKPISAQAETRFELKDVLQKIDDKLLQLLGLWR